MATFDADARGLARAGEDSAGTAHVMLWPGCAVYLGPLLDNESHAHHAIQISIGLAGPLELQTAPGGRWSPYRAAITAPDQSHRLRCAGPVAQVYLDPEDLDGLVLRERIGAGGVAAIDVDGLEPSLAALCAAAAGEPDEQVVVAAVDDIVRTGTTTTSRPTIDPRVRAALGAMHAAPTHDVTVTALAAELALSPSRLRALFRRDTGIPVRRYLLWLRLIDAIEALAAGGTLTEAAHNAGFSDSAHLSRTFRRMFGMPPSALRLKRVDFRRVAAAPRDAAL